MRFIWHIRALFRSAPDRSALARDEQGGAMVEAALGLPILILFMSLFTQFGMAFYAQAGLFHATGQAARYATIHPTPTDTQIRNVLTNAEFGLDPAQISELDIDRGTDNGRRYVEITMDYEVPVFSMFTDGPAITLSETRRAYTY